MSELSTRVHDYHKSKRRLRNTRVGIKKSFCWPPFFLLAAVAAVIAVVAVLAVATVAAVADMVAVAAADAVAALAAVATGRPCKAAVATVAAVAAAEKDFLINVWIHVTFENVAIVMQSTRLQFSSFTIQLTYNSASTRHRADTSTRRHVDEPTVDTSTH